MTINDPPDFIPYYRQHVAEALHVLSDNLRDIESDLDYLEKLHENQIINKYWDVFEKMSLFEKTWKEYDELLYKLQEKIHTYLSTPFNLKQ